MPPSLESSTIPTLTTPFSQLDPYTLLDLKRDSTDSQIKSAYRKYALKYHPQLEKNAGKKEVGEQFRSVAESYVILSTPSLRSTYDQYGTSGLYNGISNGRGGQTKGWLFNQDPFVLFEAVFGTTSPFAEFFQQEQKDGGSAGENKLMKSYSTASTTIKKPPPQEIPLLVSLEELYGGALKTHKLVRKRLGIDRKTLVLEEKLFSITLGAGWKENTRITFLREGDEVIADEVTTTNDAVEPADVIFVVKIKPHARFTRKGAADLVYRAELTLQQALCGTTILIETLDKRVLPIGLNEIATPQNNKVVQGEGIPHPKTGAKGNLIIEFDIAFPEELSIEQKAQITKILGEKKK